MVQGTSDNFNASLSTQNSIKQTHSLATVALQGGTESSAHESRGPITRLKKEELPTVKLHEPETKVFKGEKKPKMPEDSAKRNVLPLKILCNQYLTAIQSKVKDFQFFKEMITKESVPDYSGYNTKQMREDGQCAVSYTHLTLPTILLV